MDFTKFYLAEDDRSENDNWRLKYVFHRTASGDRRKVRVKSLPKEQQWKYAPLSVQLKRKQKLSQTRFSNIDVTDSAQHGLPKETRTFIVYYSADRTDGFDKFTEGKLVMCTCQSSMALQIEKKTGSVGVAHQVPIDAFIKYWDYKKGKWVSFESGMEVEMKYEKIKFSDHEIFLCDFFKYQKQITFQLSDPNSEENDDE